MDVFTERAQVGGRCAHCGTRVADEFRYGNSELCCECMSALCSWFLDGGMITDPDMFTDIVGVQR